ncbi:MAG: response regulator [Methanomassiliicoccaceae archaeon]|jgi:CheY-like chemotaxis protein|nr:response regulator [Methanomassiliicoccaceae archaeon]
MRVLIVDDNPAVCDVLSEILLMSDLVAASAGTAHDAILRINEFRPEIIFLDDGTDKENIASFLGIVNREVPRPRLYMMTSEDNDFSSNMIVDGCIRKPFKSTDILDIVNLPAETEKKKRTHRKGLFSKRIMPPVSKVTGQDAKLKFGGSYLFIENEPSEVWDACMHFFENGDDIMAVTSGNKKAVRERMRDNNIRVSVLSEKEGRDHISGSRMGSVMDVIATFIGSVKRPVIVIDDLGMLIRMNDLNSVMMMVQQTVDNSYGRTVTVLASVCPDGISGRDTKLLLRNMTEYRTDR